MYYPKSHITPNLYSEGTLSIKGSTKPYYGYYFSTIDGKAFTGRFVGDGNNLELTPYNNNSAETLVDEVFVDQRFNSLDNNTYSKLKKITRTTPLPQSPTPYYPVPTRQQYQAGEFRRYFAKKSNEEIYYETSALFENEYYIGFSIPWKLTGDLQNVYLVNKRVVELKEKNLSIRGLGGFLKYNYIKFYK